MKQPLVNPKLSSTSWRDVIWQEWQSSEDSEYATHLFKLIADKTIHSWYTIATTIGISAIYGMLGGMLIWLLTAFRAVIHQDVTVWETSWQSLVLFIGLGCAVGIAAGFVIHRLLLKNALWPKLFLSLRVGVIIGSIYWLLGGPVPGFIFGIIATAISTKITKWIKLVPNFEAEGLAIAAPLIVGSVAILIFDIGVGLAIWAIVGPLTFVIALTILIFPSTLKDKLTIWLEEWDQIMRSYDYQTMTLIEYFSHNSYHRWFFSKHKPKLRELEKALADAYDEQQEAMKIWGRFLRRLRKQKEQPSSATKLITDLQSDYWVTRFTAQHALVYLGGEAVDPIQQVLKNKTTSLYSVIVRVLHNIADETSLKWASSASSLVCPKCLARCYKHPLKYLEKLNRTYYYGCRYCKQSREFLNCPQGVTAVLDSKWAEADRYQDGSLSVNWIKHQKPFDFDKVEINKADDKTIELFAMTIGNDTDPIRKDRYKEIRCVISPDCRLSKNSQRVLQSVLGQIIIE